MNSILNKRIDYVPEEEISPKEEKETILPKSDTPDMTTDNIVIHDLAARAYLSYIFFSSGLGRLDSFLNEKWEDQIFLFTYEHPVPFLSANIAAPMTTMAELILPVMLLLGLFGRVGAAGILAMTLVMEFTYMHSSDHILWMVLASFLLIKGGGILSVDTIILKLIRKEGQ